MIKLSLSTDGDDDGMDDGDNLCTYIWFQPRGTGTASWAHPLNGQVGFEHP